MSRPATPFPSTEELYQKLDRPPWRALSSRELCEVMGISINWAWNQTMRRTGPEPEPGGIHVRASNRRFFMPAIVLELPSAREGARVEAWRWSRQWLVDYCGLTPEMLEYDSPRYVAYLVLSTEERRLVPHGRWRVRKAAYLDRLEAGPRRGGGPVLTASGRTSTVSGARPGW